MVDIPLILNYQKICNLRNATLQHEISLISCPVNSVTVSCICDTLLRNSCLLFTANAKNVTDGPRRLRQTLRFSPNPSCLQSSTHFSSLYFPFPPSHHSYYTAIDALGLTHPHSILALQTTFPASSTHSHCHIVQYGSHRANMLAYLACVKKP